MTTYTVLNTSGEVEDRHLTAWQAAQIVLNHDGHEFEVRRVDYGFQLFVSRGSRNAFGGMRGFTEAYSHGRFIASIETDEAAAYEDIGRQVVTAGWPGVPEVMTDAGYDAMLAEIARDAE